MTDRLPPNDLDSERAALGCLIIDPQQAIPRFIESCPMSSELFYDLRHQSILNAITDLHNRGVGVDLVTLQSLLRESGGLEQVGGIGYLSSLQDTTPSAANLPYYLDELRDKFIRRKIIQAGIECTQEAYEHTGSSDELLDAVERKILAIRGIRPKPKDTIKELVRKAVSEMEQAYGRQGAIPGIPTGLADLDRISGGLRPSEVTIIAGYPGSGKTSLAMNIAENAMLRAAKKVGVFSLEMSAVQLVTRFICSHARVNLKNISNGYLASTDFPKIAGAAGRIANSQIWFEDDSDLSIQTARAKARRLWQEHGIELLIIDYIQLLNAGPGKRNGESREQEVAHISRGIKACALELNIPIVALSQLNEEGKLRESRAIGHDADNVWVLKPEDSTDDETELKPCTPVRLRIVKARNGPVGTVQLNFFKPITRFESVAKVSDEDIPHENRNYPYTD